MVSTHEPKRPILRVMVLIWADMLTTYIMWIMQAYLTNVWKLGFTHAAGIMNVANGLPKVLPLVFYYFVDAGLGNYGMLLLSSFSYAIGLGLLSMSTPPVLAEITGTCKDYEPQCIGHIQKALCYTALALIAAGISGHIVSLVAFFVDQLEQKPETKPEEIKDDSLEFHSQFQIQQLLIEQMQKRAGGAKVDLPNYLFSLPPTAPINQKASEPDDSSEIDLSAFQFQPVEAIMELVTKKKVKVSWACLLVLFPVVGIFALPYIQPWSLRFGIPAICSLVATLAFLQGSCKYEKKKSKGSPVTNVFRVILASTVNMFKTLPSSSKIHGKNKNVEQLPHTLGLRLLDKAAIQGGPESKRSWLVCTVKEVEETKMVIRMIPIWITLIICGVVTSIGTTFFVEQAYHMNYKVANLKLPNSMLLFLYQIGKSLSKRMYMCIAGKLGARHKQYAPSIGIALATISAVLCCIFAAIVETRRIYVIRDHGLIDKPDEEVPMTVCWILPQYFLLAVLDSFYENSVSPFLTEQSPPSMQKYLVFLNPGLSGMGMVGSISSVYAAGRVSQRNGKPNWFQHTLNGSRLDRYYWTLAALSAVNFIWFVIWAWRYPYRDPTTSNADEQNGTQAGNQEEVGNVEHVVETIDIY